MTKREGTKKGHRASQKLSPSAKPTPREDVETRDDLRPRERLALERQALEQGWLIGSGNAQDKRERLLDKLMQMGLDTEDENLLLKIVKTLSQAEQRQLALQLANRQKAVPDLPTQVEVNVQQNTATIEADPNAVVDALLKRSEVQNMLDRPPPSNGSKNGNGATH